MLKLMFDMFGHSGEVHASPVDTNLHYLQDWFVAIPLLLGIMVISGLFFYMVTRKSKPLTYLFSIALLFVIGVTTYTTSAPMSITALTLGMGLILCSVLFSLMAPNKNSPQTKNNPK